MIEAASIALNAVLVAAIVVSHAKGTDPVQVLKDGAAAIKAKFTRKPPQAPQQ